MYSHAGLLIDILDEFAPGAHGEAAVEMLNAKARTILQARAPVHVPPALRMPGKAPTQRPPLPFAPPGAR